jgi:hypothetical protein
MPCQRCGHEWGDHVPQCRVCVGVCHVYVPGEMSEASEVVRHARKWPVVLVCVAVALGLGWFAYRRLRERYDFDGVDEFDAWKPPTRVSLPLNAMYTPTQREPGEATRILDDLVKDMVWGAD